MSRITSDLFDLAADPLQTKVLLWPGGKVVDPRVDEPLDNVRQRLGRLLTRWGVTSDNMLIWIHRLIARWREHR